VEEARMMRQARWRLNIPTLMLLVASLASCLAAFRTRTVVVRGGVYSANRAVPGRIEFRALWKGRVTSVRSANVGRDGDFTIALPVGSYEVRVFSPESEEPCVLPYEIEDITTEAILDVWPYPGRR
jgi:hypothetical protein